MAHPDLHSFSLPAADTVPGSEPWVAMPYRDAPRFDAVTVLEHWRRLHVGHGMPPPAPGPLAEGWALYHSGEFEQAANIGLRFGGEGLVLANQATAIYANYLEPREACRQALFKQVAERAASQVEEEPENWQALYWQAYALGRYSQGISVARALAQGLGSKVKGALERVIELQPRHAAAHVALAAFHAEVIDKVGALVGRMTYGVRAETAMALFQHGLELHPNSPGALMEYARGLLMLEGEARTAEATGLYERAASIEPVDARERLDVELARAGLSD